MPFSSDPAHDGTRGTTINCSIERVDVSGELTCAHCRRRVRQRDQKLSPDTRATLGPVSAIYREKRSAWRLKVGHGALGPNAYHEWTFVAETDARTAESLYRLGGADAVDAFVHRPCEPTTLITSVCATGRAVR